MQQNEQLTTIHQRYADVFKAIGFPIDLSNPTFPKPQELTPQRNNFFNNALPAIGIAPFATYQSKMYPLKQMEDVIAKLSKTYNVILFGGGTEEIKVLNSFEAKHKNVRSVAGKLNLEDELTIISNLDVMLSMDSGNGHIAAMFGVKVITIWGVTHPFAGFVPFSQPIEYSLLPNETEYPLTPTSIYGNKAPENYIEAAGSISVETIVNKIKSVIN